MSGSPDLRKPRSLTQIVSRRVLMPPKEAETGWILVGGSIYPTYDPPAFENGWQNYDPTAATQDHLQFYLSASGEVRIKGVPYPKTASATSGTTVFTLPEGYRPPKLQRFEIATTEGSRAVAEVWPTGEVKIYYSESDIGSSGGAMSRAFIVAMS